ncbi:MAG: hypothetical protein ACLP50_06185 [Solirubrobacteraceae bacterium]
MSELVRCGRVAPGTVSVEGLAEAGDRIGVLGRAGEPDEQRENLLLGQRLLRLAAVPAPSQGGREVAEVTAQ